MRFGHCWDPGQLNSIREEDTTSPPLSALNSPLDTLLLPVPSCCNVEKIQNSEENQERACLFGLMRTSLYQRDVSQSMHLWSSVTTIHPKHLVNYEREEQKRGKRGSNT